MASRPDRPGEKCPGSAGTGHHVQCNPLPGNTPSSFAISNPPRVAFDFPDTRNLTGKNQLPYAASLLNTATLVEGQGKARLVLNLSKSTAYTSKIEENKLLITLHAPGNATPQSQPRQPAASRKRLPRSCRPSSQPRRMPLRRMVSCRMSTSAVATMVKARVLIDLNNANTPVDIKPRRQECHYRTLPG